MPRPDIKRNNDNFNQKQFVKEKVAVTDVAIKRSLQDDALLLFLQRLGSTKGKHGIDLLKSQCRAYLVGFDQLPHPSHTWGGFLHDLFNTCSGNELASEVVAKALSNQRVMKSNDLSLVVDFRPSKIDEASKFNCHWQAELFISAINIIFSDAVASGNGDMVRPFLGDESSRVRLIAFTALHSELSSGDFTQFLGFFSGLEQSERQLFANHIADNSLPLEAAAILRTLVNTQKMQVLGAFCKLASRDANVIQLLLNDEFDNYTSVQASIIDEALANKSKGNAIDLLYKEGLLRHQLLNSYFVAGVGKNAQVLNLATVEWIARLDNNPLIKQQAIDFLLTINQGNSKEIAKELINGGNLKIPDF
jgi:hypothetical protein